MASAKVLSQMSRKNLKQTATQRSEATALEPPMGDIKQVSVKTANKSIRGMRQQDK